MKSKQVAQWMIYGAYGYTGQLIVEEAIRCGLQPILAGRHQEKLEKLANRYQLESRCFGLESPEQISKHLTDCELVVHAAGPFYRTFDRMLNACMLSQCHYLDITGEIEVFEGVFRKKEEIEAAGILAIPGVGFDVVPTDCLAAFLKEQLPDATELELAFSSSGGVSGGTLKTALSKMAEGGCIRQGGVLKSVATAAYVKDIEMFGKLRTGMSIPWGDVSTAFHSTGIPNIKVYLIVARSFMRVNRAMGVAGKAFSLAPVRWAAEQLIDRFVDGPDENTRKTAASYVWGQVTNAKGACVQAVLKTSEGYHFTAQSTIGAVNKILGSANEKYGVGPKTPSLAFGHAFLKDLGVEIELVP